MGRREDAVRFAAAKAADDGKGVKIPKPPPCTSSRLISIRRAFGEEPGAEKHGGAARSPLRRFRSMQSGGEFVVEPDEVAESEMAMWIRGTAS
jgi:hypothetical protein